VRVGEDLHYHRPLASRLLARIQSFAVLPSLVCVRATEDTAVAEDRSASKTATAPDDLHNEDPRSHLTTQRANAAPALCRLRATAAIAVHAHTCNLTQAAELQCLALLHLCMIEERWLWRPAVLQNARHSSPLCLDDGVARNAVLQHSRDSSWQADQPHLALRPLPASSRSADGSG